MVKCLFKMARALQPCVIFIDEVDSILTERSESEHEASRRLKTEFLLQFDGVGTAQDERILVLGATNRPQEIYEAALRRFVKRIYIPLPEPETRLALLKLLLQAHEHALSEYDFKNIVGSTQGYSGSDLTALAREASMGPIRSLGTRLLSTPSSEIPKISLEDFYNAMKIIRPSVSPASLKLYHEWNRTKGSLG